MPRTRYTLRQILEKAITKEVESQDLYTMMADRVHEPGVKTELLGLVDLEREHQEMLQRYERGGIQDGALGLSEPVDWKIAEHLEQPAIAPDMQLRDVFLLAANREKASHEFYHGLANLHRRGAVRTMFEQLAAAEAQHKRRVEFLFTEVAFPQTDGG